MMNISSGQVRNCVIHMQLDHIDSHLNKVKPYYAIYIYILCLTPCVVEMAEVRLGSELTCCHRSF